MATRWPPWLLSKTVHPRRAMWASQGPPRSPGGAAAGIKAGGVDALRGRSMRGDDTPLLAPNLLTPQRQQGSLLLCPLHPADPFLLLTFTPTAKPWFCSGLASPNPPTHEHPTRVPLAILPLPPPRGTSPCPPQPSPLASHERERGGTQVCSEVPPAPTPSAALETGPAFLFVCSPIARAGKNANSSEGWGRRRGGGGGGGTLTVRFPLAAHFNLLSSRNYSH